MKSIIILLIVLFSFTAHAQNMTGLWNANGMRLVLLQAPNDSKISITTSLNSSSTGLVTLQFDCSIDYKDGKITMMGWGNEFKAVSNQLECTITPYFIATGIIVGERPGRRFHASGNINAITRCTNGEGEEVVIKDLDGIWK